MNKPTIRTNHQWRTFLYGYELTPKERSEFNWLDWTEDDDPDGEGNGKEDGWTTPFFRYKGVVYSLDQFVTVLPESPFSGWDGYHADSYFSGVLIRVSDDGESFQVATFIS